MEMVGLIFKKRAKVLKYSILTLLLFTSMSCPHSAGWEGSVYSSNPNLPKDSILSVMTYSLFAFKAHARIDLWIKPLSPMWIYRDSISIFVNDRNVKFRMKDYTGKTKDSIWVDTPSLIVYDLTQKESHIKEDMSLNYILRCGMDSVVISHQFLYNGNIDKSFMHRPEYREVSSFCSKRFKELKVDRQFFWSEMFTTEDYMRIDSLMRR